MAGNANVPDRLRDENEELDLVRCPPAKLAYVGPCDRVGVVYRRRAWRFWHLTLADDLCTVRRDLAVGEEDRAAGLWRAMEAELDELQALYRAEARR